MAVLCSEVESVLNFKGLTKSIMLLILSHSVFTLAGCDGPTPSSAQTSDVVILFSHELSEVIAKVHLTVADVQGNILESKNLDIIKIDGDRAYGTVFLYPGEYLFNVQIYNNEGYLIGQATKQVTITQDRTESITVQITGIPEEKPAVTINVNWDTNGACQTIPAVSLNDAVYVYRDAGTKTLNNYFPSGWMGDIKDIAYDDAEKASVYSGETSVRITYTPERIQEWAGIVWLPVPTVRDDWGNIVFGIDLTGVTKLTWYARGAKGGERVEFFAGGVTDIPCPDSLPKTTTQPKTVTLTTDWQQFEIDLSSVLPEELTYVVGGFGWTASRDDNPDGFTFYIDEIKFVK